MDFVLYVVNKITTTDFDNFAETEREIIVERDVYWHDGVEIDVRNSIKFDSVNKTYLALTGDSVYADAQSVAVTNIVSKEISSFSNSGVFCEWLNAISVEEIPNYIFEVYYISSRGKTTVKYFVEKAEFEEPTEHKKAKLYKFEGFSRTTNEVIPKLTFTRVGCDKGLLKIKDILQNPQNGLSTENSIILLNGIDISDYFVRDSLVYVIPRKNGAEEYDGSRFRIEYAGVQEKITILEGSYQLAEIFYKDKPDELKETRTRLNNEIEQYRKMLASNQRIHGGN